MRHAEVAIVGAGPAGTSCAARLAAAGVDVLLLDRAAFPRPKPCAGWLTPRVFDLLDIDPEDYPGLLARFERLYLRLRGFPLRVRGPQYAIRRVEFDAWLLERCGVPLTVHEVRSIESRPDRFVIDDVYSADVLVGAGGSTCPVYRTFARAGRPREAGSAIVALEEEFESVPADDRCRLWFFDEGLPGYAWYVPKGGAFLNVGIGAMRASLARRGEALRTYWQRLIPRLETAGLVAARSWRPVGREYHLRQRRPAVTVATAGGPAPSTSAAARIYLVGDALGLATLDMGEGIAAAIESGRRAAAAILGEQAYSIDGIARYSLLPPLLQAIHGRMSRRG